MRSFWHLEKGDFFDGIEECKEHFLRSAQRIELKKNDIVFFEGDAGGACFYVASGLLRIFCVTEAGKESTFFLRTAGEIFGLSEVLQDLPRKVNAQALAASVIFRLDRQAFDDLLSRNYALARRVIAVMGSRLRYLGDSLSVQTCDVRHRVGRLLLSLAHESLRDPAAWEQPLALPVSLSQGQMAAMVCSTQPTVSETLHQLQDEGLIDIRGRGIVIRRPQALLAALVCGKCSPRLLQSPAWDWTRTLPSSQTADSPVQPVGLLSVTFLRKPSVAVTSLMYRTAI